MNDREVTVYTVREVSDILRTNRAYVYDLIESGVLPAIKLKSLRVRKEALDKFLRESEGKDLSDLNDIKKFGKTA